MLVKFVVITLMVHLQVWDFMTQRNETIHPFAPSLTNSCRLIRRNVLFIRIVGVRFIHLWSLAYFVCTLGMAKSSGDHAISLVTVHCWIIDNKWRHWNLV